MQLTSRAFYADSLDSSLNGRDQTRIAIAGGGLSGICVALHIQRYARSETIIDIYESTGEVGNGPAYAWRNPAFLLNGEAAHLSMFDEQPLEFVQWLASTPHAQPFLTPDRPLANQFVPRYLFSDYIRHCLGKAHSKPSACVLRVHRNTTVLNIEPSGLRATLVLSDGERCPADRVIVATGNEPPCPSSYICRGALCIENPWIPDWVDFVAPGPVLMVGTGQTMVDAAIALWAAGHDGVIHSVSRRGVLPKTHVYNVPSWNIETAAFPGNIGGYRAICAC